MLVLKRNKKKKEAMRQDELKADCCVADVGQDICKIFLV